MSIFNRYTQSPVALVNPMSMEELAFAPTFLRQRHDQTAQALSDLDIASGQYDVLNQYQPIASQLVDPLQKDITNLANELATKGINGSRGIPQAMKLKSQYANLFGQSGAIGQLQNATKQYRTRAEELKKQYEKNPLLQQYALSQLQAGEAILDNGKLQMGEFKDAQMVRDIAEEDILDRLNKAAGDLKPSDLSRSGIMYSGPLGSFNDLYTIAQKQGVSEERVTALMNSLLSTEEQLSLAQLAKATGEDPEKALERFGKKMRGIAATNTTSNTTYRDFNVSNEMKLHAAKKQMDAEAAIPFRMPTGRINDAATNLFTDLSFDEKDNVKFNASQEQLDPNYWRKAGYNVVVDKEGEFTVSTKGIGGNVPVFQSKEAKGLNDVRQEISQKFLDVKNSNPELASLSNKEALARINEYQKNKSQRADVAFLGTLDKPRKDALSNQVIAMMPNVSVYGPEGKGGTLDETVQQLGFKDYKDFAENGKDSFTGLTLFGPNGTPAYTYTVTDADNKRTTMYVEADLNTQELATRSTEINRMILNADIITPDAPINLSSTEIRNSSPEQALQFKGFKPTQIINEKTGQSYPAFQISVNPIGTNAAPYQISLTDLNLEGNKSYYELVSDFKKDIQGKPISEVKKILSNKYGLEYEENYIIQDFSTIQSNEEKTLLKSLPYLR